MITKEKKDLILDIGYNEFETAIINVFSTKYNVKVNHIYIIREKDDYSLSEGFPTESIFVEKSKEIVPDGLRTPIVVSETWRIDDHDVFAKRKLWIEDIYQIMLDYEKMTNKRIILNNEESKTHTRGQ